ncbi:Zinc finger protein with KRAB and SCAN domains 2 [Dissostichus eleginoides]|uniref:Zinc finger protein with KRAB and SCAN domains 2 n=1 Tax=Dissostichus eleginoides TaxID=100907 RepID=A0AAD9CFQ1_DISEL|nr:Zinc finger protein with KRAB and SCAN domains 2 [Dissostichus eleginoides]
MQTIFGLVQLRNPSPLRSRDLTPAEFALAFSFYRKVICSVYPTRRTDLDEYLFIELDMALRFGGSGFYTYHVHFASQATGRIKLFNQGTYRGALDSELYCRIFAARASLSCQSCGAPSHLASACSVSSPPPQTPHSLPSPSRNASDFNRLSPAREAGWCVITSMS